MKTYTDQSRNPVPHDPNQFGRSDRNARRRLVRGSICMIIRIRGRFRLIFSRFRSQRDRRRPDKRPIGPRRATLAINRTPAPAPSHSGPCEGGEFFLLTLIFAVISGNLHSDAGRLRTGVSRNDGMFFASGRERRRRRKACNLSPAFPASRTTFMTRVSFALCMNAQVISTCAQDTETKTKIVQSV